MERVSMKIVVQSNQDMSDLKIVPGNLKLMDDLANGVGKSGSGCGIDTATQHISLIKADGIDYVPDTKVPSNNNQPVWITVKVPEQSVPGKYKGQLEISYGMTDPASKKLIQHKQTLTYDVLIKDRILPAPSKWKFHLDLWQYPESVA